MKTPLPWLLGGLFAAALVADSSAQGAPDEAAPPQETFSKHCASCHSTPDVRFATDRVWLDRVLLTA
jgi:hypothetical protein